MCVKEYKINIARKQFIIGFYIALCISHDVMTQLVKSAVITRNFNDTIKFGHLNSVQSTLKCGHGALLLFILPCCFNLFLLQ